MVLLLFWAGYMFYLVCLIMYLNTKTFFNNESFRKAAFWVEIVKAVLFGIYGLIMVFILFRPQYITSIDI
jgi:hypothetical protein